MLRELWAGFLGVAYYVALLVVGLVVTAAMVWVAHWFAPGSFGNY